MINQSYLILLLLISILICVCDNIHVVIDDKTKKHSSVFLKADFYKENIVVDYTASHVMSYKFYELTIYKDDNIFEIVNEFCTINDVAMMDCIRFLLYCKKYLKSQIVKPKFGIVAAPFKDTIGGTVVSHYLVDRLNYYFAATSADPIAYVIPAVGPDDEATWDMYYVNPKYNTPKLTKFQYENDEDIIIIYPESLQGNPINKRMLVRWILYFLHLENKTITESPYQYQPDDYIACYSQGICTQFDDDNWHKHPLRVIDLNWDMFDSVDTNRIRDIDVVYFKPLDRKRTWIDKTGCKIILDYDSYEYMLNNSFALMNRTLTRMDASLRKQERIDLLARTTYFISFDPATFRSVEAAMVGCLSIVTPVPGVDKAEWASVSYAPEYLQYRIAYGFDDLDHARSTIGLVLHNLHEQDSKTKEILVNFIKDIKRYFNLDPDFLKDKLE